MYWTDSGRLPAIWTAKIDGNSPKIFVSDQIEWPTGLAVDLPAKRLYWADTKQRTINAINFDGTQRSLVLGRNSDPQVDYPYLIAIFEDSLYGITWKSKILFKINKFGKGGVTVIERGLRIADTATFRIMQQQLQVLPPGK